MRKLAAALALFSALTVPIFVRAQLTTGGSGLTATGTHAYGQQEAEDLDIAIYVGKNILQPILGLVGLTFLVLTIYAGIMWMTSAGEEKRIKKAKDILVTSILGAVIVASAYVITNTIIGNLSDPSVATEEPEE